MKNIYKTASFIKFDKFFLIGVMSSQQVFLRVCLVCAVAAAVVAVGDFHSGVQHVFVFQQAKLELP